MKTPERRTRLMSALFDLTTAGVVFVLGVMSFDYLNGGWPEFLLIATPMAAAVLVRRRWPLGVMAAVSLLAFAQILFDAHVPQPYDVAVLIAMYAVVKYGRRVWHAYLAAAVVGLGIVILVLHLGGNYSIYVENGFMATAGSAAVWLTAYVLRTRRLYVASLEERAATAERERDHLAQLAAADERAAIARELHDVVAHSLAVMIVQADGATYALDTEPEQARGALGTIASTGRDALDDMRRIVGVLRGTTTADDDGAGRRRIGLDQLDTLIERARSAGLEVDLRIDGGRGGLTAAEELTVFRLAQEALTNALRHAGQRAVVSVTLAFAPGAVTLEVIDDGAGQLVTVGGDTVAPPGQPGQPGRAQPARPQPGGHGLVGMRERVAVHGGQFAAGPRLGGGWQVRAVVPLKGVA
jgi:signal transduction histidine kinase